MSTEIKMDLIKTLFLGAAIFAAPKIADAQTFHGMSSGYEVQIDLHEKVEGYYRTAIFMNHGSDENLPYEITGHNYEKDDQWNRIFIKRRANECFNSISFVEDDSWLWEPCPGYDGEKFTSEEIKEAIELMNKGMGEVTQKKKIPPNKIVDF